MLQIAALIIGGFITLNVTNSRWFIYQPARIHLLTGRLIVSTGANIICTVAAACTGYLPEDKTWMRLVAFWLDQTTSLNPYIHVFVGLQTSNLSALLLGEWGGVYDFWIWYTYLSAWWWFHRIWEVLPIVRSHLSFCSLRILGVILRYVCADFLVHWWRLT